MGKPNMDGLPPAGLYWGSSLQPGHVPWPGIASNPQVAGLSAVFLFLIKM